MASYTVIYRTGGPLDCQWRSCRPVATMQEAVSQKDSIMREGRKAIIYSASGLAAAGLPVGWCRKCDPSSGKCQSLDACVAARLAEERVR